MYSFSASLILGLGYVAQAYAAPVEALHSRDLATCQDPNAGIDQSCWDLLDLTTFITNWNQTTPVCPPGPTTGKCCGATEAWTTCFLRMNQPESGSDCTTISSCAFSPSLETISNDSHMTAQAHYVVFNIYALNQFFSSWYTSMAYATTQAQLAIDGIVSDVDPNKKASGLKDDILLALTLGLAFLGGPEAEAVGQVTATGAKTLITALQQAPGAVKALWPQGSTDTQIWQMASLSDDLGNLDSSIRARINAGLQLVQTDVPTFLAFAAGGQFSMSTPPSIDKETAGLEDALKTYLVSKALDSNNYMGIIAIGLNQETAQSTHGKCTVDLNSPDLCTSNEINLWHSDNSNADYQLAPKGGTRDNSPASNIMKNILDKKYTTGNQLYDAAATCNGMWDTDREAWNEPLQKFFAYTRPAGVELFKMTDKGIDFSCLSQLTIWHEDDDFGAPAL